MSDLSEVYISYIQAKQLLERRFFCEQEQHTIGYAELPDPDSLKSILNDAFLNRYATSLFEYLQAFNRNMLAETLTQLTNELYHAADSIDSIRLFLTDLYRRSRNRQTGFTMVQISRFRAMRISSV